MAKSKTVNMPFSPVFETADYFLFPKLKTPTKGKCFATNQEINEKSKREILAIPKSGFQNCFED